MTLTGQIAHVLLSIHKHALKESDTALRARVASAAQAVVMDMPGAWNSQVLLGIAQTDDFSVGADGRIRPLSTEDRAAGC